MCVGGTVMGLFDRIVRNVTREATRTITNAVSDSVSTAVNSKIREMVDENVAPVVNRQVDKLSQAAEAVKEHGKHALFEVKLKEILESNGSYELKNMISVEELEQGYGQDAYTRGRTNGYKQPAPISYGIYQDGVCKLYIRLWKEYSEYNRAVNREVLDYCKRYDIPMLDFFEYLPNESAYIKERIASYL